MDETLPWEGPGHSVSLHVSGREGVCQGLYSGELLGNYTEGETRTSTPLILYVQCVEHAFTGGAPEWAHLTPSTLFTQSHPINASFQTKTPV